MHDKPDAVRVLDVPPENLGWKRRSDLDCNRGKAWQLPDGSFYLQPPGTPESLPILWAGSFVQGQKK
jgi:hypothetical protein